MAEALPSEKFGIIFDLDGTLTDSVRLLLDIPGLFAKQLGITLTPEQDCLHREYLIDGISGEDVGKPSLWLRFILGIVGMQDSLLFVYLLIQVSRRMGLKFRQRVKFLLLAKDYYKENVSKVEIFDGTTEALQSLRNDYDGSLEIGVLSTSSTKEINDRFVNRPEFLQLFGSPKNIVGRDKVEKIKPSPLGIIEFSKRWNIPVNKLIMIGDMNADILAGKNAGTITVGVLTGAFNRERMEKLNPDYIFEDVAEFVKNLTEIRKKFHL